jgi:CheY-like chemotaxis protein
MSYSILVADDEEGIRHAIRQTLEMAGFDVCEAANGIEVVKACEAAPFDLAIIDVFMPHRDGLEAIMAVRKQQPDLKIIAVSGAPDNLFLENAAGLGATCVLSKPFRPQQLLRLVNELLGVCPDSVSP